MITVDLFALRLVRRCQRAEGCGHVHSAGKGYGTVNGVRGGADHSMRPAFRRMTMTRLRECKAHHNTSLNFTSHATQPT